MDHSAKRFQRRRFLKLTNQKTRIVYGGRVCKRIRTKWALLIEGLSEMLPIKFCFIWLRGFSGEHFFRNWPKRNKNCLWWPILFTDWDQMSNLYRWPSIGAPYQVSVHFVNRFQRRRFKCEKLRWHMPRDSKSSLGLSARWTENENTKIITYCRKRHIHDCTHSWLLTDSSITKWPKLLVTEMMKVFFTCE